MGKRRDENPIILVIKAKEAWRAGLDFYHVNEKVWLADSISIEYIEFQTTAITSISSRIYMFKVVEVELSLIYREIPLIFSGYFLIMVPI